MNKLVCLYQPDKHYNQLVTWHQAWGLDCGIIDLLPTTGIFIEDKCALFWYETNSKACYLEGFICNPSVPKEDRVKYFDMMGEVILHLAKEKGYKYIMGYTKLQTVVDEVSKFGAVIAPGKYNFYYRSL